MALQLLGPFVFCCFCSLFVGCADAVALWHIISTGTEERRLSGSLADFFASDDELEAFIDRHRPSTSPPHWVVVGAAPQASGVALLCLRFNDKLLTVHAELSTGGRMVLPLPDRVRLESSELINYRSCGCSSSGDLPPAARSGESFSVWLFEFSHQEETVPELLQTAAALVTPLTVLAQRSLRRWLGDSVELGNELAIRIRDDSGMEMVRHIPTSQCAEMMATGNERTQAGWRAISRRPLVLVAGRGASNLLSERCVRSIDTIGQVVDQLTQQEQGEYRRQYSVEGSAPAGRGTLQLPASPEVLLVGDPAVPALDMRGFHWSPKRLRGSQQEVVRIALQLGSDLLTEESATLNRVLERIERANIIHFACHASSLGGYIALAGGGGAVANRDDLEAVMSRFCLVADQIDALRLNPRSIVVLSCCDGSGQMGQATGNSLAHHFLAAGAGCVIGSSLKSSDLSGSIFFPLFYDQLVRGFDAARSLEQTRRLIQLYERFVDPIHWASFSLMGNNVVMTRPEQENRLARKLNFVRTVADEKLDRIVVALKQARENNCSGTHSIWLIGYREAAVDQVALEYMIRFSADYPGGLFWLPVMVFANPDGSPNVRMIDSILSRLVDACGVAAGSEDPQRSARVLFVLDNTEGGPIGEWLVALHRCGLDRSAELFVLSSQATHDESVREWAKSFWSTSRIVFGPVQTSAVFFRLASALAGGELIVPTLGLKAGLTRLVNNVHNNPLLLTLVEHHLHQLVLLKTSELVSELESMNSELEALSLPQRMEVRGFDQEKKSLQFFSIPRREMMGALKKLDKLREKKRSELTLAETILLDALDNPGEVPVSRIPAEWILFNKNPRIGTPAVQRLTGFMKWYFTQRSNAPMGETELVAFIDSASSLLTSLPMQGTVLLSAFLCSGLLRRYPALDTLASDAPLWQLHPFYLDPLASKF